MNNKIEYSEFSSEVKNEISKFHEEQVKDGMASSMEISMRKWFEEKFDDWLMNRFPDEAENKRKFIRVDVELPVKICETLIDATDDVDDELVGEILNISKGGLYFKSKKEFSISSILKVVIDMSKVNPDLGNVEALAMVMRMEKIKEGEYGVGLMFSTIYDEAKEMIDMVIFKHLSYFFYND